MLRTFTPTTTKSVFALGAPRKGEKPFPEKKKGERPKKKERGKAPQKEGGNPIKNEGGKFKNGLRKSGPNIGNPY